MDLTRFVGILPYTPEMGYYGVYIYLIVTLEHAGQRNNLDLQAKGGTFGQLSRDIFTSWSDERTSWMLCWRVGIAKKLRVRLLHHLTCRWPGWRPVQTRETIQDTEVLGLVRFQVRRGILSQEKYGRLATMSYMIEN